MRPHLRIRIHTFLYKRQQEYYQFTVPGVIGCFGGEVEFFQVREIF